MNARFSSILFLMTVAMSLALGQVPRTLNHQGYLTNTSGVAVDTTISITFQFFTDSTDGSSLWSEAHSDVLVTKGIFSVTLGPVSLPFDQQYWLQVEPGSEIISPRTRITSSAYSLRADIADNVSTSAALNVNSLTTTGYVGIGTTTPLSKLHVSGSQEGIRIQGTSSTVTNSAYMTFYNSSGTRVGYVGDGSAGDNNMFLAADLGNVNLYTSAGRVLTATSSGRVGIGTETPTYLLHVISTSSGTAWFDNRSVSGSATGLWGYATGAGGTSHYGVYGYASGATTNWAGYFSGNVRVTGTITKTSGSTTIDHPLDPLNKYLTHSSAESPDMLNIYNGNITTDANGEATVTLPSYFQTLNIDYKYQLTAMGQFAQAIILNEVENNQFIIKTDKPSVKVSWQITGVRNDEYARRHRIIPEVEKSNVDKGKYLNPELYGLTPDKGINAPPTEPEKPSEK